MYRNKKFGKIICDSNLDAVWLIVADVDLVTSVAGGNPVGKLDGFHDAELVQDRSGLLAEDDHSLYLALDDDDVAKPVDRHAAWVLQDVRTELADESTVPRKYLYLHEHSKPEYCRLESHQSRSHLPL